MWWNVLIIPSGYRYKIRLGDQDLDKMFDEYKSIDHRAKVKFACEKGINPNELPYNMWREQEELKQQVGDQRKILANKYNSSLVPSKILGYIKSTEPDHLDIIANLDVENENDFSMNYGSGEQGGIDILMDALDGGNLMLAHSSLGSLKKGLQNDYRYHKLSDEGKKQAMKRVENESRMQDAQKVKEWIERLENAIAIRNKRTKADTYTYGSVFDGLK